MFVCGEVLRQEAVEAHQSEPLQVHHASHAERHHPEATGRPGLELDQHLQEATQLAHQQTARY